LLFFSPSGINVYAEEVPDASEKLNIPPERVDPVKKQNSSATVQLADTGSQDAMRPGKPRNNQAIAEPVVKLKEVVVLGKERGTSLVGETQSASQGFIGQAQIKNRALSRVAEVVEFIPGMIATQHSGDGKANQYFLRGFNLDHGTDFATFIDGVPINLPSHAHGQGYMDLNGLIPELIDNVQYGKGPYYADQGDFSAAGHAKITTFNSLPQGFAKFTGGSFGFYRGVAANSNRIGGGDVLYAIDVNTYNGPWVLPEHALKFNGMLKYSIDKGNWGASIGVHAYHAKWRPTNQIPLFAVNEGLINRFGNIDPTDNGETGRYTLHGKWWQKEKNYRREASFYLVKYSLDLTSDFSGFINSVADNIVLPGGIIPSDQVNQTDSRIYFGGRAQQSWLSNIAGFDMENTLGIQVRNDFNRVLLSNSNRGVVYHNVSRDRVTETSMGLYLQNQTFWLPKLRTIVGLRGDIFNFNVHAYTVPQNSGNKTDGLVSPKLSVVLGPWHNSEIYFNVGEGYHSNDARGVTATVNTNQIGNNNFAPQLAANGLVRAKGAEVGFRTEAIEGLKSTLAIWYLHSASELVFSGDAGTTETSGASTRYGIEWANFYRPSKWLVLDADFSFTHARYDQAQLNQASDPANQAYGFHIPNAVGRTISAGATLNLPHNLFATLRLRHFGNVSVDTNNPVKPYSTTIVNLSTGYELARRFKIQLDVLNLLNAKNFDIAYYYGYQTSPSARARDGLVFHPIESRMYRVNLTYQF
jgi:outer membrane receptor protein involved in Fe transport